MGLEKQPFAVSVPLDVYPEAGFPVILDFGYFHRDGEKRKMDIWRVRDGISGELNHNFERSREILGSIGCLIGDKNGKKDGTKYPGESLRFL